MYVLPEITLAQWLFSRQPDNYILLLNCLLHHEIKQIPRVTLYTSVYMGSVLRPRFTIATALRALSERQKRDQFCADKIKDQIT